MRVIAGTRRSMPLKCPKGMDTRPTQDRTKETLFNVLQTEIAGSEFLDLFSGSGAIGIEALSRGARHATFVENAKPAIQCIKENITFTKFSDDSTIMEMDVFSALERLRGHEEFDIIFMDPPYMLEIEPHLIQRKHPFLSILFTVLDKKRTFLSNTVVLLNKNHGLHVKHDRTSFHARTIL